jgi:hypothetical protein
MMSYDKAFELYETTGKTIVEIADECGINYSWLHTRIKNKYPTEFRQNRKVQNYSESKQGPKNPMYGKKSDKHPNFVGDVSDGKGYLMRLKPEWYTGRQGSKYVFVHHIVICESLGLTEIPKGFCVHHIDHQPTNNELNNLTLLTVEAHSRLHQLERATTIPKGSRA